ncbi:unnamed protein product [Prunus armeniaca]|uniref:C2 domain-containing protein n=1 Tax=Prunus armeniaca TaxID=36596 RepID=A0A6J5TFN5_PRUAR|nr:unnamed protein product [Prunus armeniaca]
MEQRTLELELISAKDLKDVNFVSKMDVYAVVSLQGDDSHGKQKTKTKVAKDCGTHPTWNFPMKFTLDELLLNRLSLEFKLVCDRSLGDKDIGQVVVPVKELFDSVAAAAADPNSMKFVAYQVRKPSGKPKGELHFSYKFGDKVAAPVMAAPPKVYESVTAAPPKGYEPVTAYPMVGPSAPTVTGYSTYPPPAGSSKGPPPAPEYGYPPPPPGYGYPPPHGYGYPPPPPGYGYPPVQQPPVQEKKKNKFGMGLGAGLLGGMLGGMLIGDIVSDGGGGCGGGGCGGGGCGGGF